MSKISTIDLYWAAGFLEGEGCFGAYPIQPLVTACQVAREPIDQLQRIFGGTISCARRATQKDQWVWKVYSRRAAAVMMTLYVLLSPRRQTKIEQILTDWKGLPARRRAFKWRTDA